MAPIPPQVAPVAPIATDGHPGLPIVGYVIPSPAVRPPDALGSLIRFFGSIFLACVFLLGLMVLALMLLAVA